MGRATGTIALLAVTLLLACDDPPEGLLSGGTTGTGQGHPTTATGTTSSNSASASSGSGNGSGGGVSAPFTVSTDTTSPEVKLDDDYTLTVTVDPHGFAGDVALSASDLSTAGVTAAFADEHLTLDGTSSASTTLTLTTASSSTPGSVAVTVSGVGGGKTSSANVDLMVLSDITIVIPQGVDGMAGTQANPYQLAFGPYPIDITAPDSISDQHPVTVRFFNDDDVEHEIHAGQGDQGFGHGQQTIPPHGMDPMVRKVNTAGTYDFYLHDQNGAFTTGRIVIQ